jgi:hypothetical protein
VLDSVPEGIAPMPMRRFNWGSVKCSKDG